jgi:hypothetical protein
MAPNKRTKKETIRHRVREYLKKNCAEGQSICKINEIKFEDMLTRKEKELKSNRLRNDIKQLAQAWKQFIGENIIHKRVNVGLSYQKGIGAKLVAVKPIGNGVKLDATLLESGIMTKVRAKNHPTCLERKLYIKKIKNCRLQYRFITGTGSFINHACEDHSNVVPGKGVQEDQDWRNCIVAKRDIKVGEEIMLKYSDHEPYPCRECTPKISRK